MLVDLMKYYLISIVLQNRQKCCYNGFLYQHYEVEDFEMLIRYCNSSLAAIFLIFAFNGNALAEDWEGYLGGGITYSDADCDGVARTATVTVSGTCDEDVGYRIHAGADYIDSGFLLGIEAGYAAIDVDYSFVATPTGGNSTRGIGDAELDSFFYGTRFGGSFMDNRMSAYLRLGLHTYDLELGARATVSGTTRSVRLSDDGTELYYGIGVEYDIWKDGNHAFGVRLDYTLYDVGNYGDIKSLDLTGQYEFGY